MDATKIQIGLDFFSAVAFKVDPAAVTPADLGTKIPYETYDDDATVVYVIVSAYLIQVDSANPGLKLDDYFLVPTPIGPRFEILDHRQSPPEGRTVPVPFPPNTALTLTLKDVQGTAIWSDSRVVGLDRLAGDPDDTFSLARDDWKAIAIANGQVPPARSWADLVPKQRELALNWPLGQSTTSARASSSRSPTARRTGSSRSTISWWPPIQFCLARRLRRTWSKRGAPRSALVMHRLVGSCSMRSSNTTRTCRRSGPISRLHASTSTRRSSRPSGSDCRRKSAARIYSDVAISRTCGSKRGRFWTSAPCRRHSRMPSGKAA